MCENIREESLPLTEIVSSHHERLGKDRMDIGPGLGPPRGLSGRSALLADAAFPIGVSGRQRREGTPTARPE